MESNDEFQFRPITSGLGFHNGQNQDANLSKAPGPEPKTPSVASNAPTSTLTRTTTEISRGIPIKSAPAPASPSSPGSYSSSGSPTASEDRSRVTADSVSRLISSLPHLEFQKHERKSPSSGAPSSLLHKPLPRAGNVSLSAPNAPLPSPMAAAMGTSAGPVGAPPAPIPGIPARDARRMTGTVASVPADSAAGASPRRKVSSGPSLADSLKTAASRLIFPLRNQDPLKGHQPGFREITARRTEAVVVDETKFREVPVQWSAAAFDLLVIAGTTCLFAVALLLVTNTDLRLVLHNARSDWATRAGILLLFFSVHALYMVGSRSVAGCTLGEWAFDTQLGLPPQQATAWYPLAICARFAVTALTGFITLPIISNLLGRDITAHICGVKLYQIVK